MESQPRASGGTEGKSSDDIVFELSEMVKNTIMDVIKTDEAQPALFKVSVVILSELFKYKIATNIRLTLS